MSSFVKQVDGSYADVGSVGVGDIAGNVVDDTQIITIPASGAPPIPCEDYYTESGCTDAGCYWYDDACHGTPKIELPLTLIAIGGAAVVSVVIAIFILRR